MASFKKINNNYYYVLDTGVYFKGWLNYQGNQYYFDTAGIMITGYYTISNKVYYFDSNGILNNGLGIIVEARKHIGKKYLYGGNGPDSFDCSGFTKYVYNKMKITLYRITYDQVKQGKAVKLSELKLGDLVFSNGTATSPGHVAIYSGNGKVIHAANSKKGVLEEPIYGFLTARRILD